MGGRSLGDRPIDGASRVPRPGRVITNIRRLLERKHEAVDQGRGYAKSCDVSGSRFTS